ncbi:MAG: hypothetical protein CME70_20415 [Halobacteriovorax sp.]|nr:hypothetical protein [Halobacteriovorax sp.]
MKYLAIILFIFSISAHAEFKSCKEGVGEFGNLGSMRYQVGYFEKYDKCFLSIGPNNRYPKYRGYHFDSAGELMVFNSLGAGRPSKDTGARNFQFPVITSELKYKLDFEDEYILIQSTDGRVWTFDAKAAKLISISEMDFVEDPDVTRTNDGGLELSPKFGTIVDQGWRVGGPPNIVLSRNSVIKNDSGLECSVKNKKLFKLIYDNAGGVDGAYFIHSDKDDWEKFLKKNCKNFGL